MACSIYIVGTCRSSGCESGGGTRRPDWVSASGAARRASSRLLPLCSRFPPPRRPSQSPPAAAHRDLESYVAAITKLPIFEGDRPVVLEVLGEPGRGHAAAAQLALDRVAVVEGGEAVLQLGQRGPA